MNLPNKITFTRILIVPFFMGCLMGWEVSLDLFHIMAAFLFAFACLTDGLDGFIAKRTGKCTRLGNLLDPLADKLLLITSFMALTFMSNIPQEYRIPGWLTFLVLFRDVLLLSSAFLIYALYNRFKAHPNLLGKATTVAQMSCIMLVFTGLSPSFSDALFLFTGGITALSGIFYLRMGSRIFSQAT